MKPWEPQKGESFVAFQAFSIYLESGAERSLRATVQKLGKNLTTISEWSKKWEWVRRAGEYDAHMAAIEQRGREKALEHASEDWATEELAIARELIKKGRKMLEFPLATTKSRDGLTIVEPARWGFGDASKLMAEGVKIERLARGESTDNVTVDDKRAKLAEILGWKPEEIPILDNTEQTT